MWRKLTSALKHGEQDTTTTSTVSQGDVMGKVLEQHPNLSMFHPAPQESVSASPPASPTKSRRSMFKRASRMPSDDDGRAPSPAPPKLSLGIPKKVKSSLSLAGNRESLFNQSQTTI
ncbi:hypothetical protein F5890DRAFT_906956 [Lentinula detonsa]|uniref:Uncharacterized protein n=1 Tax=Lentinula detonsa TaxID=2804962 RepID=A0AA38Q5F3_9AGAR|nr:hypothetical protein F5890DRAFT_906956 [Lentinula detonsa]